MAGLTAAQILALDNMCPAAKRVALGTFLDSIYNTADNFTEGTPVNAVAATGTLTIAAGNAQNDNTVTVGGKTYTFKTTLSDPAAPNEVLIGADASESAANLVLAVLAAGTAGEVGVKYSTGTTPNSLVTASSEGGVVTFTAKTKGTIGNAIGLAKNGTNLTVTGATLGTGTGATAGVDGTVGEKWQVRVDASYLYVCIAANTTADTNWRRVSLGSAY